MNIQNLIEKAQYYEKLTRQHKEATDFLQALECSNPKKPRKELLRRDGFDEYAEIQIATPAVLIHGNYKSDLIYKVNLTRDLGMDFTNEEITKVLKEAVKNRLAAIEDELTQIFDYIEESEDEKHG